MSSATLTQYMPDQDEVFESLRATRCTVPNPARPGRCVVEHGPGDKTVVRHGITGTNVDCAIERLVDAMAEELGTTVCFQTVRQHVLALLRRGQADFSHKENLLFAQMRGCPSKRHRVKAKRTGKPASTVAVVTNDTLPGWPNWADIDVRTVRAWAEYFGLQGVSIA